MFPWRKSNNLIEKIDDESLRTMTDDKYSDFQTLIENCNQLVIHQRNLQVLMREVYKIEVYKWLYPPIMEKLFVFRENVHNIRNF